MTNEKIYLITEEQLDIIERDDFFKLPYRCEMWEKRRAFTDSIRSHPYNPQADDIDEWCKLHEEVLKDIRTEAYRSGYQDGERVGRETVLDELASKLTERKRELLEQYETGERSMLVWERRIGILEALDEIGELQQEGKVDE